MFYQYYPGGFVAGGGRFADPMKWGPTHWGHAITEDLVHWDPSLPVALYPDSHPEDESLHGMIYSGSAVIDWHNTSGFRSGDDDLFVACFTQTGVEPARLDHQTAILRRSTAVARPSSASG